MAAPIRNRSLADAFADHPSVIAFPPALYAGAFVIGIVLHHFRPTPIVSAGIASGVGLIVLCIGAVLALWGRRTMEAAGTHTDPSRPATVLVVAGPFRFSRNPMYVARTVLYVGLALLANAFFVLALLAPLLAVMHYGVIKPEEHYLEAKFGEDYRQYCVAVRRWV